MSLRFVANIWTAAVTLVTVASWPTPAHSDPPADPPGVVTPGRSFEDPSQRTAIRGRVVEATTGEPVPGAFLVARSETWTQEALSDADGTFVIEGAPVGEVEVTTSAELFRPITLRFEVAATEASIEVALEFDTEDGGEVVLITGEAPKVADPTSYEVAPEDIRVVPGAGNDTLKALQSMPGVSRIPFGLGGLVLRGSSPRDTNVYLDGIEVPLLYHFGGLASFYPSDMLASLELVPGGFSAQYGRAQGGVVELTSRSGRADRWRVASEVSLTDASIRADGPGPLGGTWSLGLRRSYVDAVLGFALPSDAGFNLTLAPRYYDGQLRYEIDLGRGQRLSVMLFGSDDRLSFLTGDVGGMDPGGTDQDRLQYVSSFVRAGVRWQRRADDVDMSVTPWVGWDTNSLRFSEQGITRTAIPMGVRADIGRTFASGYVSGGIDIQGGRLSADINNQPPSGPGAVGDAGEIVGTIQRDDIRWYGDIGVWLEGLYRLKDDLISVKPGLRLERYGLTGEWVVDPRLNVAQALPAGITLKQSLGIYHQPPVAADLDPIFGNRKLTSSYAVQSAAGAEIELPYGFSASTTGFYEQLYDVPVDVVTAATPTSSPGNPLSGGVSAISSELISEQFGTYTYQENVGQGRNYGVETLIRGGGGRPDRAGNWLGWISYTYSRALRRGDPALMAAEYPYVLDQPHVLTALGSVKLTDNWRLGARIRYATGNPITPVVGRFYDADAQEFQPMNGAILSERLPAFFQLDVRLDRSWKRSWGTLTLFLDLQNATNRGNAEGVSYSEDYTQRRYTVGLPIFPSIGLSYRP